MYNKLCITCKFLGTLFLWFYGIFESFKYNAIELLAMHKTDAGEKRKALKKEALELVKEVKALARVQQMSPAAKIRQDEADRLKAEAKSLKGAARLEDLHVWQMEKTKATKKGPRKYTYWMATWREGGKTRNVHLGSCRKMSTDEAMQKARAMKAAALAISP